MKLTAAHLPHLLETCTTTAPRTAALMWLAVWAEREYGECACDPTALDPMAN